MNQYVSTRNPNLKVTSKQAILQGISEDGGLFVWPELDCVCVDLESICQHSYMENALTILKLLLHDFEADELKACIDKAYQDSFSSSTITPMSLVDDVYVLELYHGPTSAFKDIALTLLPHLMSCALNKTHQKALILTATSGDTGKAALNGFMDVENIAIQVFYPHQKVSEIQYRQMATQQGNNVCVSAIEGNFDDAQSKVKDLFLDAELQAIAKEKNILLTSANSINIGRLIPQIVYYFESYKVLVNQGKIQLGQAICFSVPTGNFGDVLAGYYAYLMGLPIKKLIVASNANHVLTDFISTGVYDRNREFVQTISPSMDILISSNLERLLYYISNKDTQFVASCMNDLKTKGRFEVPKEILSKIQSIFDCGYVDDESCKQVILDTYKKTGVVLDPHTAIGYKLAKECKESVVVSLATASCFKFSKDVLQALEISCTDEIQALHTLSNYSKEPIPLGLAQLEHCEILHKDVIQVKDMKASVLKTMEKCL